MSSLDELLDAAVERVETERDTETVEVLIGGELWIFRFAVLDGVTWANVIAVNPMRPGSNIDARFGYNYDGAAVTAAPLSGVRVVDDESQALTAEQWSKVIKALSGHDFQKVTNAVWLLNEIAPGRRVSAAKKALTDATKKKAPSQES